MIGGGMARECWIFETTTGRPLQQVHPATGSWTTALSGNDGTFTFELADPRYAMDQTMVRDLFRANARTMAVINDGVVEYEGVNRTPRYFEASETLQVRGRSMLETFAPERMTFGVDNYPNGDLPILNRTHAAAVRLILERFTRWSAQWALPIDLPANAAGTYSDDVKRWDTAVIGSLLRKVQDQGVEVWLRPYLDANRWLRYQTRVEVQVAIGSAIDINVRAPGSPATGVSVAEDGSRALTGAFAVGEGNELSTLTGWAGYMDGDDIPVRDAAVIRKKVNNVAALNGVALAELKSRRNAVKQWSFDLQQSKLGRTITPGTLIDLDVRGSRWTPNGRYRQRVLSVRGTWGSDTVTPEVQPYGL